MDCHFHFIPLGFCLCLLSSLALQTSGFEGLTAHLDGGVFKHPTSGKRVLVQIKELQAAQIQDGKKEEAIKSGQRKDSAVVPSEMETSLPAELPAGIGHDNTTKTDAQPTNETADSSSFAVPPLSIDKKDETYKEGKIAPKVDDSDDHVKDNDTNSKTNSKEVVRNCGGSHCQVSKISACLSSPGDGPHKLSLFLTYEGDASVLVKVTAPEFLIADPKEVSVSKGKSETIHFSMDSNHEMDPKAMQNKAIVVTSVIGNCEIEVPMDYLSDERAPTLPSMEPRMIAYLLVCVFIISCVGAWLCYKCRRKKRAGDVKYQQLEMNGAGSSTPKERVEGATESWDEVWDDDWEDAEAAMSSSRLNQSLSSRGLAARRGTKDGRDNSWED